MLAWFIRTVIVFSMMTFWLVPTSVHAEVAAINLLVDRSNHTLYVKRGNYVVKKYRVALGLGGRGGKQKEGDGKTPTGDYKIIQIRDSDRFHLFLQLNYPNIQDAKAALKNNLITRNEYVTVLDAQIFGRRPPQDLPLGGAIGIHGIGEETDEKVKIHQNIDWTEGCIALRNEEVEELSRLVSVGTKITIID